MISVSCPTCGATLKVKDEHAGKKGKCPSCTNPIRIPTVSDAIAPSSSTVVDRAAVVKDETLSEFIKASQSSLSRTKPPTSSSTTSRRKAVDPARALKETLAALPAEPVAISQSSGYKLALVGAAILSVMLPIAYLSIIGFFLWLELGYLSGIAEGTQGLSLTGIAWLIGESVVLYVMIRPLLSIRFARKEGIVVEADREPILWHFIEQNCRALGATVPREIRIDIRPDANAGLRKGLRSLFASDFTLVIGLPLIATLKVDQLAAISAQELANFRQGTALRLLGIITLVNEWLVKASAGSDSADEAFDRFRERRLEDVADGAGFILKRIYAGLEILIFIIQILIGFPRAILWVLLQISSALCGHLLRERQLNADRFAYHLVGSKTFEVALRQVSVSRLASTEAMRLALERWGNANKLPESLPDLAALVKEKFEDRLRREARSQIRKKRTDLFETEVPIHDRIARAKDAAEPGLFVFPEPATMLLMNYEALARKSTFEAFSAHIGPRIQLAKYLSAPAYFTHQS